MLCSKCQYQNDINATFCGRCGSVLSPFPPETSLINRHPQRVYGLISLFCGISSLLLSFFNETIARSLVYVLTGILLSFINFSKYSRIWGIVTFVGNLFLLFLSLVIHNALQTL